jgi:hypothetical protein
MASVQLLRRTVRGITVLTACCLLPAAFAGSAAAQSKSRYKIEILPFRVGFSPGPNEQDEESGVGQRDSLYKIGAWVPVTIRLNNVGRFDPDPKKDGPAVVILEAPDCDDTITSYTVPVPQFDGEIDGQPGLAGSATVTAYTRTGNLYGAFTVRVVAGGKEVAERMTFGQQAGFQSAQGLNPNQGLYLALGSRLAGLNRPDKQNPANNQPGAAGGFRKSFFAVAARTAELPTVWFAYSSADAVILSTSDRDFATALINDRVRNGALTEWVRRGGRLIVSAGANADLLPGSPELNALLPVDIGKQVRVPALQITWREGGTIGEPLPAMSLAGLSTRDKRGHRVLVDGPEGAGPVVVQGAYGLGRVTVVAFDPDKPPVSTWAGRNDFWRTLLAAAGPHIPESAATNPGIINYRGRPNPEAPSDNEQNSINSQLEQFEGVPVISFGWVALFILLYILVVGPLDYLFLKKVVKRLELTWITFPTIVLAVSAAAYFTAYHLKGSELRINKLDVVDIDQQTGRTYGRTFFAVFSPRIQKYTIGLEPAAAWAAPADTSDATTIVSWFGASREIRESLLQGSYDYAPRAAGLRGVPIQVWSLKGFQADWAAPFAPEKPPVENRLRHPSGRPDDLIGSVTSKLPVTLEDVLLIYRGEVASLGTLLPDTPKTVTAQVRAKFSTLREGHGGQENNRLSLLFHEASVGGPQTSNGSLRDLDQSWRLTDGNRDEVILVGRVAQVRGQAQEVGNGPASPSRIWMDTLPIDGTERPELRGNLRQDTIVRVFLPLAPEPTPSR